MALLNPPNILPNGMHLIAKYLAREGQPVDRQRLKALLQPSTLPLRADGENTFDVCLKALLDLHLVISVGPAVSAAPHVVIPGEMGRFAELLLRAICADAARVPDDAKVTQHDLLVSLTWWCAQDPYGCPVGWKEVETLLSHDLGAGRPSFPLSNETKWQAFVRWAHALGFAEHDGLPGTTSSTVVVDMTRAVTTTLRSWKWSGAIPAAQLVSFVQDSLPIVDGGALATMLRGDWELPAGRRVSANALDLAVSHALLRSVDEGVLGLENRSDAGKVLLSDGPEVRPVSHLALVGAQT